MTGTARAPERKPFTVEPGHRAVRSFVLRQGRFTPAQQRAFDALWPRFGLDYQGTPRDFDAAFGRQAPRILEIGFGNGEALRYSAARDPDRDHVGIEVHAPGVGRLLNALGDDDARNVRLYHHDAVEVLQHEVADASLDEARIYFPDPWHKKRHQKRRLVSPAFAALLVRKLAPDGRCTLPPIGTTMRSRCGTCSTPPRACAIVPARADMCRGRSGARKPTSKPAA